MPSHKIDFPTHFQYIAFLVSHKIFHLLLVPIIAVSIVYYIYAVHCRSRSK
jgi:hypothetical protein